MGLNYLKYKEDVIGLNHLHIVVWSLRCSNMMVGEVLIQDGRPPNAQLYLAKQPMFKDNVTCHTIIER